MRPRCVAAASCPGGDQQCGGAVGPTPSSSRSLEAAVVVVVSWSSLPLSAVVSACMLVALREAAQGEHGGRCQWWPAGPTPGSMAAAAQISLVVDRQP